MRDRNCGLNHGLRLFIPPAWTRRAQNAVNRQSKTVAKGGWVAFGANDGALPANDEKRGEQIRVFFSRDLPRRLGERNQSRNPSVPEPDTFGDLRCESGGERRTLRREGADELEWGHFRLARRRCYGLKVPPEPGSSGLTPALTKGFHELAETLK